MNYTAPDKVAGDQWSSTEHNQMKAAVNSKMDSNKLVHDFSAPSNSTYPDTQSVVSLFDSNNDFRYRGVLTGSEDLMSISLPGFYVSNAATPSHSSYPIQERGVFRLYKNGTDWIREYVTIEPGRVRFFIHNNLYDSWEEFASRQWIIDSYGAPDINPPGDPTLNDLTPDIALTKFDCTDKQGRVLVSNVSASTTNGTNVIITFEYPRNAKTAQITPYFGGSEGIGFSVYQLSNSLLAVRIVGDIPISGSASFFYNITE